MNTGAGGEAKRTREILLELWLQNSHEQPTWVIGTSARTARILNHWAMSPASTTVFESWFLVFVFCMMRSCLPRGQLLGNVKYLELIWEPGWLLKKQLPSGTILCLCPHMITLECLTAFSRGQSHPDLIGYTVKITHKEGESHSRLHVWTQAGWHRTQRRCWCLLLAGFTADTLGTLRCSLSSAQAHTEEELNWAVTVRMLWVYMVCRGRTGTGRDGLSSLLESLTVRIVGEPPLDIQLCGAGVRKGKL